MPVSQNSMQKLLRKKDLCSIPNFTGIDWIMNIILTKSSVKKPMKTLFRDNYPRLCLDKKGFIRWIQLLNPNIIDKNLRQSFLIYQEMIFDFLYGAAEEQKMIGSLNAKLQNLKLNYRLIGIDIRTTQQKQLRVLNNRYQYSLSFTHQKKTIEFPE